MPRADVAHLARERVEVQVGERRAETDTEVIDEPVQLADDLGRLQAVDGVGAQRRAQLAHRRRGLDPAPDDVADDHPDAPVRERDHVVPVPADLRPARSRQVAHRELDAVDPGQVGRQHAALQRGRGAALPEVLDHADEVLRVAIVVAEQAPADLDPDRVAERVDIALLEAKDRRVARDERLDGVARQPDVVGMRDGCRVELHELLASAPHGLAERVVDLHEAPLQVDERHADRRLLERDAEALLALAQRRLRRALAAHVARDRGVEVDLALRRRARDDDLRRRDLVAVAVHACALAAPDAFAARHVERLAAHPLARPRGRELADLPAGDVLVGIEADHLPPGRVDVDDVVVAVGDRDPVRGRLQHGAVAALERVHARALTDVVVDDEQHIADPRRRDLKPRRERLAAVEAVGVADLRAQRRAALEHRGHPGEQDLRKRRQGLPDAQPDELVGRQPGDLAGPPVGVLEDEVDDPAVAIAYGAQRDGRLRKLVQRREGARGLHGVCLPECLAGLLDLGREQLIVVRPIGARLGGLAERREREELRRRRRRRVARARA